IVIPMGRERLTFPVVIEPNNYTKNYPHLLLLD
ncbi:unnamed protein product, partial [marine sediment metagenome]